ADMLVPVIPGMPAGELFVLVRIADLGQMRVERLIMGEEKILRAAVYTKRGSILRVHLLGQREQIVRPADMILSQNRQSTRAVGRAVPTCRIVPKADRAGVRYRRTEPVGMRQGEFCRAIAAHRESRETAARPVRLRRERAIYPIGQFHPD